MKASDVEIIVVDNHIARPRLIEGEQVWIQSRNGDRFRVVVGDTGEIFILPEPGKALDAVVHSTGSSMMIVQD